MRDEAVQAATPSGEPTRPGWSLLGCGCGAVMTVALLAILALTWYGYETSKGFEKALGDPAARNRASRRILGYRELPEGYHPMGGFSVLLGMRMAMLSDRDPAPGETVQGAADAFRHRGFVFMKTWIWGARARKLRDFFAGRRPTSDFFQAVDLRFDAARTLGRGAVDAAGGHVLWVAERGTMKLGGAEREEVLARLLVECPGARRLGVAMWFEPAPVEGASYGGTPADPGAITRFLNHFRLCDS